MADLMGTSPACWLRVRRALRAPSSRLTNLKLLVALALTFATGVGAVATGSTRGRWVVVAHGIAAMLVILMIPWKTRVVRAGLRRRRAHRWASLSLAGLAIAALLLGLGSATGLIRSVGNYDGLWLHIAAALALVPLAVWHILARRVRVRRTDLSRRTVLRAGAVAVAGASLFAATAATIALVPLPGARRRFTGSYQTGSFQPVAMPTTIWLDDTPPLIDAAQWRLSVVDRAGRRELTLDELSRSTQTWRVTLDCTSGWYAEQDWTGIPLAHLVSAGQARSVRVRSQTGYWVRLPVSDLDKLLLATRVGGQPLSVGHGFPLRLVAPGRRGFWWVKWVDRIELQATPWWWQPPFPVT
jgi:hypothetical protein